MGILRAIDDWRSAFGTFLSSTVRVSNFLAVFLVMALMALLFYTIVARSDNLTAVVGVATGIIGAITGYYFNKEQLNTTQREQRVQGGRAGGYLNQLQTLESEHAALTADYDQVLELFHRTAGRLPDNTEV